MSGTRPGMNRPGNPGDSGVNLDQPYAVPHSPSRWASVGTQTPPGAIHSWSLITRSSLYCNGNPEREGFEPSWRVSPPTAFPGLGTGAQGGAPAGTPYSDSQR